jgi:hypothetical protein
MTRAANAIVATIRTESGFQPTRRDRMLIYFPLLAAKCRPSVRIPARPMGAVRPCTPEISPVSGHALLIGDPARSTDKTDCI